MIPVMNTTESDQLFLGLLTHDLTLVLQVMAKVLGGLFLSPDAIAIYVVFALGFFAYWLKGKLNA
jgi:hypothetical protein